MRPVSPEHGINEGAFRMRNEVVRCLKAYKGHATSRQIHRWFAIVHPERNTERQHRYLSTILHVVAENVRNPDGWNKLWVLKREYR